MLRRLRVKNFKLLRDVELELANDAPTVLIGTNASGKSTVVEVLDLLARAAIDGLDRAVIAHGGIAAIRTIGSREPISISTNWRFTTTNSSGEKRPWDFEWTIELTAGASGQTVVHAETLLDQGRTLVESTPELGRLVHDEKSPEERLSPVTGSQQLAFEAFADPVRYEGLRRLKTIVAQIRVLGALSALPPWAHASSPRPSARDSMVISTESYVGREGVGLANALYNLQTEHEGAWSKLEKAFRAEFPFVRRIVFPPDPGGSRISFAIEDERFPGRRIYATEMSDGMVVYLCLLSLILHPEQRATLALDEPDAHLHPSALRRLLAVASDKNTRRRLIIVTHSNALLDEIRDPAASIRIVEATANGAAIRKLDPGSLESWRSEYSLSEMRKTGLLDPSNSDYGKQA